MLTEMRAARLDLYARTKFTKDGRAIEESRAILDDLMADAAESAAAATAASLEAAAAAGLIAMG